MPAHIKSSHMEANIDTVLSWLGLDSGNIADTWVGDANIKGISGGQKRRLSIGICNVYVILFIFCFHFVSLFEIKTNKKHTQ